jgi:hypothetical protein
MGLPLPGPAGSRRFQCGRTQGRCTGEAEEPEATETFGLVVPVTRPFARTITPTGPDSWAIEHSYAAERREIFDLSGNEAGVVSTRYRTYISVLLLDNATDVAQQPLSRVQAAARTGQLLVRPLGRPRREHGLQLRCRRP